MAEDARFQEAIQQTQRHLELSYAQLVNELLPKYPEQKLDTIDTVMAVLLPSLLDVLPVELHEDIRKFVTLREQAQKERMDMLQAAIQKAKEESKLRE